MNKGERIKKRREQIGLTQVALADMIGESKQTIYKYETGIVTNIPSDKIELIAKALRVQPEWIMGRTDTESTEIPPGFEPPPKMRKVPLIGEIACGEPILAEQNIRAANSRKQDISKKDPLCITQHESPVFCTGLLYTLPYKEWYCQSSSGPMP